MREDMLDLGREIEGELRELGVHRSRDAQRVPGPVEEISVGERDEGCAHPHLLPDIIEHNVRGHGHNPPPIDRRDRTVTTLMQTPACGLHITGEPLHAVRYEARVAAQRRKRGALWDDKKRKALDPRLRPL